MGDVRTLALTLPNLPKGWLKKRIGYVVFVNKIQVRSDKAKSATKFLCVKTSVGKFFTEPFPI